MLINEPSAGENATAEMSPGRIPLALKINGANYDLSVEPRVSLLDALREFAGLTGTKKGCNQGACGACTVLVDGTRINSCLALAVQYEGREITTIEGLANGELHPLQAAFIECDGFQCGYCTSGQICSAIGMVNEFQKNLPSAVSVSMTGEYEFSDEEIKERMSGNLCRCGAYNGITTAIQSNSPRAQSSARSMNWRNRKKEKRNDEFNENDNGNGCAVYARQRTRSAYSDETRLRRQTAEPR